MRLPYTKIGLAFVLTSTLAIVSCAQPTAAPAATSAVPAASTAPAKAPVTAAAVAPTTAPPLAAASPTVAPVAPTATLPPPPPTKAAAAPSLTDLAAKARTQTEFSFDHKATVPGQNASGKTYIKGTKLRDESTVNGQNVIMLVDTAAQVGYMMVGGQNTAVKLANPTQVQSRSANPSEQVSKLPVDAKFVGTETIDGKPAAIFESSAAAANLSGAQGAARYAIWTERGLPLRIEAATAQGNATLEFTNYQFVPQSDSLFELPPGTQVIDALSSIIGNLGGSPLPTP